MSETPIVTVAALLATHEDRLSLTSIFHHCNWRLELCERLSDCRATLNKLDTGVVISACHLPDGDWKSVLQESEYKAVPIPLIVASRFADDRLWAEVLNLGGYDVLTMPFDATEVFRSVSLAWRQARDKWLLARQRGPGRETLASNMTTGRALVKGQ